MVEWNLPHMVCLTDVVHISLIASETDGRAGQCRNKRYKISQIHCTQLSWIQGSIAHHLFTDCITYTWDAHWAALHAGLSADCGLSYQPLGPTVTPKERKGRNSSMWEHR